MELTDRDGNTPFSTFLSPHPCPISLSLSVITTLSSLGCYGKPTPFRNTKANLNMIVTFLINISLHTKWLPKLLFLWFLSFFESDFFVRSYMWGLPRPSLPDPAPYLATPRARPWERRPFSRPGQNKGSLGNKNCVEVWEGVSLAPSAPPTQVLFQLNTSPLVLSWRSL